MHQIVCSMRESAILLIQAQSRRVLVMFKVKHLMLLRGDAESHMLPARLTMDSAARIPTMDRFLSAAKGHKCSKCTNHLALQ